MSHSRAYAVLGVSLIFLMHSASAIASHLSLDLTGSVEVVDMTHMDFNYTSLSTVSDNPDGSSLNFMGSQTSAIWDYEWDIDADADPFIGAMLTFTNLTSSTKTFNVTLNAPVSPAFSPALKSGSFSYSFDDTDGSGSAGVTGISWDGLIDGSSAMSLTSGDSTCSGTGCSLAFGPISDGPLLHPAGVTTDIGILLSFDLTAGDTVTFNTLFEVNPVPVPAAVWLFGSGLLGLVGVARRRKPS
ncbi:MAG: VPLPA-CTERM sorting domain-containing protein [Gammaproteobacteria bacterium]|jgi:hypothetical protein